MIRRISLILGLTSLICFASGCQAIFDTAMDNWDYNNRVDAYRDRGYSEKSAKRNAFEDQYFDNN